MLGNRGSLARISCQILFAEATPGKIVLDCIVGEDVELGDRIIPQGMPFEVQVTVPQAEWVMAAKSVLDRWSDEGCILQFEFWQRYPLPQLAMTDGVTKMLLDYQPAPGA